MKTILAIDGGGIRGILPGRLLQTLQESSNPPKFDMIAGTSTGGILAIGMASGIPAKKMLELYTTHGGEVFDRQLAGGFISPKYAAGNLERLLHGVLGERKLSQASPEILIPSYCVQYAKPGDVDGITVGAGSWFFKSWVARTQPQYDFPMWQVARATSAAPTYFPTAEANGNYFVDGGMFANNPAACALADARNLWPNEDDIRVLSLGTGAKITAIDGQASQDWGAAQWVLQMASVFMDGAADTVSYIMHADLDDKFLRCEIPLVGVNDAFDDASALNISNLLKLADKFTLANLPRVEAFLSV